MSETNFIIRPALISDAATIARHRARMFQDMGEVTPEMFEPLRSGAEQWLTRAFATGEYLGWLATREDSDEVIAGAGVQVRQTAPHPRETAKGEFVLARGRQAVIVNVFTEQEWRRRGLAQRLMNEILNWARAEKLDRLILHASAEGRALYERLGFARTNEMRFSGDLSL